MIGISLVDFPFEPIVNMDKEKLETTVFFLRSFNKNAKEIA